MMIPMDPWQRVQAARDPSRFLPEQLVERVVEGFVELRGDRVGGDDPAMLTGVGRLGEHRIAVAAHRPRQQDAGAAGLRKAMRMAVLAERFDLTFVALIHVAGRYPHTHDQGALWQTVGQSLDALMQCRAPSVAVLVGEGVSGGALALCVADRLICFENAYLAPTSPEGVSAILWKTAGKAEQAASLIRGGAQDLHGLGLCTAVVSETDGVDATLARFAAILRTELAAARAVPVSERAQRRRARFLEIGGLA